MHKASNTKRRQLVIGNWKMNGNRHKNADLLAKVVAGWQGTHAAEVVVCPPYPYFQQALDVLDKSAIALGSQSVSEYSEGAYTGDVSAQMLADWQCEYVIIGHNERRRMQQETDAQVAQKFIAVQAAEMIPILCVGESQMQREQGDALKVIGRQLHAVIDRVGHPAFLKAVVAYEPVWAVGTGVTATPEQAQEVHHFIREQLGELGSQVRVVYGGSVKSHNAEQLFALADIDGALLGGASLDAEEFLSICAAADLH